MLWFLLGVTLGVALGLVLGLWVPTLIRWLMRPRRQLSFVWAITTAPVSIPSGVSCMADMQAGTSKSFGVKIVDQYGNVASVQNPAWRAEPADILTITASNPPVAAPGRPDQGLPGAPARPDQGLPKPPAKPDQGLPPVAGRPGHDLPNVPARPDQGLPPSPGRPDQGLPGERPPHVGGGPARPPARPGHELPETPAPKPAPAPLSAAEAQYYATVHAEGTSGGAVLSFSADADLGEGVKEIVGTVAITVLAGQAVSIEIAEVTGTPKK